MSRRHVIVTMLLALLALPAAAQEQEVREASQAGVRYPAAKAELESAVDARLAAAGDARLQRRLFALIVPCDHYRLCSHVAAWAYKQVPQNAFDRVILIGPAHGAEFEGFSVMDVSGFETPLGVVPLDAPVCDELRKHALHVRKPELQAAEYSLEVQLPFLQRALGEFRLVPLLVGQVSQDEAFNIARALAGHVTGRTLIVVSTNFTRYGEQVGYVPFAENIEGNLRKLDLQAAGLLLRKDAAAFEAFLKETEVPMPGGGPLFVLLALLPNAARGALLQYDTSGRMTNDFSNSVSYVSLAFETSGGGQLAGPGSLTREERRTLLAIARATMESVAVAGRELNDIEERWEITKALREPKGAFVTLRNGNQVRGHMGIVALPEQADEMPPLYDTVHLMAEQAAARDPRFPPVTMQEVGDIRVTISVLSTARPVESWRDIKVGEHGIVLRQGDRQAVLLPDTPVSGGWNREQTLARLAEMAGLPQDAWRAAGVELMVFTAEQFDEEQLQPDIPMEGPPIRR